MSLAAIALWLSLELCVPKPAFSQSAGQCVGAASLWMPSDGARDEVVTKWQNDIKFSILSHEGGAAAVKLVEAAMDSFSHQTGLKTVAMGRSSEAALPDVLVVVDPNVSNDAWLLRELALKFFQSRFRVAGRFQIDADAWDAKWKSILPKCAGLDVEVNHARNLSFIAIQEDATSACVRVGLGQAFGMLGIRNYYALNNEEIPEAIFEEGLRGLYSPKIRIGMKRAEVIEILDGACKQ